MREILTALQGFLATVHRFDEAALLVEIPRLDFLHQLVGIGALLSGGLRQFRFEFGREVDFHAFRLGENRPSDKCCTGWNTDGS